MLHTLALVAALAATSGRGVEPGRLEIAAERTAGDVVIRLTLPAGSTASHPGLLAQPWRLYIDVTGARPSIVPTLSVAAGVVSQVRMALNRTAPPVTRVVIDLSARPAWRIERAGNGGWVQVVIEDPPPAASAGRAPAGTSGTVTYAPAPAPAPAIDRREAIRAQLSAMTPAIAMMRAWTGPPDAELAALVAALDDLTISARAMKVTGSEADYALVAAVDAAAAAVRARVRALADGTAQSRADAITAARGASLLLEEALRSRSEPKP